MWCSQLPGRAALSLCLLDSCMQCDRKPWQVMAVHVIQKMQCLGLKCAVHLVTAFTFTNRTYSVWKSLSGVFLYCMLVQCGLGISILLRSQPCWNPSAPQVACNQITTSIFYSSCVWHADWETLLSNCTASSFAPGPVPGQRYHLAQF